MARWTCGAIALTAIALAGTTFVRAAEDGPRPLYQARFDGPPADGWSWLREDNSAWRTDKGGLEIRVQPGDANTVRNALVRKAPDRSKGRYAIEVTVTFLSPPTHQFEQGGITWYHQGKPVLKLVHEHIDGRQYIIPGKIAWPEKKVDFRLFVTADRYEAQFRASDKEDWRTAGSGPMPAPDAAKPEDDQVSIQCYQGPADAEHWIRFEGFRVWDLGKQASAKAGGTTGDVPAH